VASTDQYSLADLLRVMERLRDPDHGCPWDLDQDFRSIVPSTLEECYELAEAIEHDNFPHVAEELGDVMFQVVFYAQLGKERGLFSFDSVVHTLVDKLVRRHPHVFANGEIEGVVDERTEVADVKITWEAIKQQEREARQQTSALADVPVALPALVRAQKLQKRAARVGFDWSDTEGVLDKVEEEVRELRAALTAGDGEGTAEEVGDVLFSMVNLVRHLKLDAESALRHSSAKFESRFTAMESIAGDSGASLAELDQQQLERLWEQVKSR